MDKAAIPKFGSFRSKARPRASESEREPPPREDSGRRREHHRREEDDRRKHRHDHNRQRQQHNDRNQSDQHRHRRRSRDRDRSPVATIAPDEFDKSDLFIVDRRGDARNIQFGSLHRYSVPAYRSLGYGNVIGVSPMYKISRDESNDREVTLSATGREGHNRARRILTSKYGKSSNRRLRLIPQISSDLTDDSPAEYIPLGSNRKRKHGSESVADESPEVYHADYRSVEGRAKGPIEPEDEDLALASDSESDIVDEDASLKHREENAELYKHAKAQLSDWQPWLALVDHQSNLVRPEGNLKFFTTSERRTLADLRLSILSEALANIGKTLPGRDQLLYRCIEEGEFVWDKSKLALKWTEALSECSSSILLWTKYLDFIQDETSFRYESCKETYVKCMRMLAETYRKAAASDKCDINLVQMYVLRRVTSFIRSAGYEELAISVWQALLEFHFFMPEELRTSTLEDQMSGLEDFWESEAPRIGEHDANGWSRSQQPGSQSKRKMAQLGKSLIDPHKPLLSFVDQEMQLSGELSLPASMDDDEATKDPFNCVMFDDIHDIVGALTGHFRPRLLIESFLASMGMPSLPRYGQASAWEMHPHLHESFVYSTTAVLDDHRSQRSDWRLRHRIESTQTMFADAFGEQGRSYSEFLCRSLEIMCSIHDEDDVFAEYFLAWKLHASPGEAAKAAKRLLKLRPSSLRLYNAYALIEGKLGHFSKANDVWTTALRMKLSFDSRLQEDKILLWHSRLLWQVRNGRNSEALRDLISIVGGSEAHEQSTNDDHLQFLKATRMLEETFDRTHLAGRLDLAPLTADLIAWLSYLSDINDLERGMRVYRKYTSKLYKSQDCAATELLMQSECILLEEHINAQRPYKPAILRQELEQGLQAFPNNSVLLRLHSSIAAQDRLRALLREQRTLDLSNATVVQWSHKLADDLDRMDGACCSTINAIRSTFSKALLSSDSAVQHSPHLWQMWLYCERKQALASGSGSQNVRQVFLDGLRHLQWHKQWAVVGMKILLESGTSESEMTKIYEAMIERGLRVRVDIENL